MPCMDSLTAVSFPGDSCTILLYMKIRWTSSRLDSCRKMENQRLQILEITALVLEEGVLSGMCRTLCRLTLVLEYVQVGCSIL